MWRIFPRERGLKFTFTPSITGLTLEVKFDELLTELCLLKYKCVCYGIVPRIGVFHMECAGNRCLLRGAVTVGCRAYPLFTRI
jgi:hypothetical protein